MTIGGIKQVCWYTKSLSDNTNIGLVHWVHPEGNHTFCNKKFSSRWWIEDCKGHLITCKKCMRAKYIYLVYRK
jgi:hypothetical protein